MDVWAVVTVWALMVIFYIWLATRSGKRRGCKEPVKLTITPMPRIKGKYDATFRYIERMIGHGVSDIDAKAIVALIEQEQK